MDKIKALVQTIRDKNMVAFKEGFDEIFTEKFNQKCGELDQDVSGVLSFCESKCKK